jgi:predicted  nucleic acid-binding Zn-ribbon protein
MKIPAWLRKKPSGTRTAQEIYFLYTNLAYEHKFLQLESHKLGLQAHHAENQVAGLEAKLADAESKLAAALVQKDDWQQQSKDWQADVMRWRVHAQAAESKLAAALLQKDDCAHWERRASYWRDRALAAESKLAAALAAREKPSGTRTAQELGDDCAYCHLLRGRLIDVGDDLRAAESKLAASDKQSVPRTKYDQLLDCFDKLIVEMCVLEDKLDDAEDKLDAAESKLAARKASLAKYEVKRKAKRKAKRPVDYAKAIGEEYSNSATGKGFPI